MQLRRVTFFNFVGVGIVFHLKCGLRAGTGEVHRLLVKLERKYFEENLWLR